jgi:hypothetical protein
MLRATPSASAFGPSALAGLALVAVAAGLLFAAPQGARAAEDRGNLSVSVTDESTPNPAPSGEDPSTGGAGSGDGSGGSSSGGSTGSGSGSGSGSGGAPVSGSVPGTPITEPVISSADEVSVDGMLYVGGLNASATPNPNPADGTVDMWFTVRNASSSSIDARAKFWLTGPFFDYQLDVLDEVAVGALQAGETRVVSATLHHGGQWAFLTAHVTLTPPDSVDGVALAPVTREAGVLLFPWLIAVLLVLAALGFVILRVVRSAAPLRVSAAMS